MEGRERDHAPRGALRLGKGVPRAGLVVRLAWDLRVPVDAAELLASEVLVRLGARGGGG